MPKYVTDLAEARNHKLVTKLIVSSINCIKQYLGVLKQIRFFLSGWVDPTLVTVSPLEKNDGMRGKAR